MFDNLICNVSKDDRWTYPSVWVPEYLRRSSDIVASYEICFRANRLPIPSTLPDSKTQLDHILLTAQESAVNLFKTVAIGSGIQMPPKGAAEARFMDYIQKNSSFKVLGSTRVKQYFLNWNKREEGFTVKTGDSFRDYYYPDMILVDEDSKLVFDIEIDEPYSLVDGKPHHVLWFEDGIEPNPYDNPDEVRNEYISQHRVVVVRFAEEQVVRYPAKCLVLINEVIRLVTENDGSHDIDYSHIFDSWSEDMFKERWTEDEASIMAYNKYRDSYLNLQTAQDATYTPREGGISVASLTKALEAALANMPKQQKAIDWNTPYHPPQNDQ